MCMDPVTMTALSVGTSLAGGVMGAIGSEDNASVQAQIARNNANTAQWNANIASQQGEQQSTMKGMQTAQTVGKVKTGFGASGVDVNSGSPASVAAAVSSAGMTDQQTIKSDAARTAWGYETQSTNFDNQATVDKQQGDWGALSSLLGGASSSAKTWSQFGGGGGSGGGGGASVFNLQSSFGNYG